MGLPFDEQELGDNTYIRIFNSETTAEDFEWHRDREDRKVTPLESNDWLFQMDNELPIPLDKELFIPKGIYHRVIPGTGILKIMLVKLI